MGVVMINVRYNDLLYFLQKWQDNLYDAAVDFCAVPPLTKSFGMDHICFKSCILILAYILLESSTSKAFVVSGIDWSIKGANFVG